MSLERGRNKTAQAKGVSRRLSQDISWAGIFLTGFVPCFLIALMGLALLIQALFPLAEKGRLDLPLAIILVVAPLNAGLCGLVLFVASAILSIWFAGLREVAFWVKLSVVAGISGALSPLILLPQGVFTASLLVLALAGRHALIFFSSLRIMLEPDYRLSWSTMGKLCLIYMNLMTAFTVINFNLAVLSAFIPGMAAPFEYSPGPDALIDAIYFSIVLMTTVGFGDIHPLTTVARIIVAGECLVSYVMFALLVGLVVRGVSSSQNE